MNNEIKLFIEDYTKELREENVAVFAGAGMSIPSGHLDWRNLLKPLARELQIDIERENDLVSLAQYYCNENGGSRQRISQLIMDEFSRQSTPSQNHKILSRLPISTYWTINYDKLIEKALENEGKIVDVKYSNDQLTLTKPRRNAIVYKMHGDVEHPHNTIIIKDDYEKYVLEYEPFITALSGDLICKTFLFIGISFTDPNLDYILSRIRITYKQQQRRHYCFMERVIKKEEEKIEEFEYRKRKQELWVQDLKRFNIKVILLDSYNEITGILQEIEKNYKQNKVFISGSANEYGIWKNEDAKQFIHKLSIELIKNDFNIISGFGLGVGSLVITGALEELCFGQKQIQDERLVLRPFPQEILTEHNREELWKDYRQDMINKAGISIFIFGNKIVDDNIVNAQGVRQEFEIALSLNNKIIPVGATGFMAEEIWNEVKSNFQEFYPDASEKVVHGFESLNDKELDYSTLIKRILHFIELVKD